MDKASVAVGIIARNAEKTIAACLDSITPYVEEVLVCVDATTTDNTAQIARDHNARVVENHVVSEYHTCPVHGRILAQHFAKARQSCFDQLRKDVDFHMWIDSDDIVEGTEKLPELLSKLPVEVSGVWLPYHYARAGAAGPTTTLFDRERIVRTSLSWQWLHRVHEVLVPVGAPTEAMNWVRTDEIKIIHQGEGHDTHGSARRNITLLEIDLEENEQDMRAWFYLGNQYFALSNWPQAITCYERASQDNNPYQLWQTLIYLSMAYEKLGNLDASRSAAYRAIDVQPNHPEPYYRLATCYMLSGDLDRCEFWTQFGDRLPDPPFFAFRNPMDRSYNARLTLATAYANAGRTSKAREQLEFAAKAFPTKEVTDGIIFHKQLEADTKLADAYVSVLNTMTTNNLSVPDNIWRFGRVRDVVVPSIILNRSSTQPRIIFFCGRSAEPWSPVSINTTGIGGSETAVIQIAKRFAKDGYRVDVYNDCDKLEGEYETVGYWDCKRLREGEQADILVGWRNPQAYQLPVQRRLSLLWAHDLNQGAGKADGYRSWDKVLGVSAWHRDYLSNLYELENVSYVPNGVELERFEQKIKKIPFRCVYASSPDRGLERLLELWPRIVENEPTAELHIAYGWDTMDKYIAIGHAQLSVFKEHIIDMVSKTPGVIWRGRLPQNDLAKLYAESYALLYPSDFLEVSCIVAVESMAAGCVVVASGVGALPETIGDGGLVVPGNVYTRSWRDYYTYIAKAAIHTPEIRKKYECAGKRRAKSLSWDKAYNDHWRPTIQELLEGEKSSICV